MPGPGAGLGRAAARPGFPRVFPAPALPAA